MIDEIIRTIKKNTGQLEFFSKKFDEYDTRMEDNILPVFDELKAQVLRLEEKNSELMRQILSQKGLIEGLKNQHKIVLGQKNTLERLYRTLWQKTSQLVQLPDSRID